MLYAVAAALAGYLLGALPTAHWAARLKSADVFSVGSGNMGAMNTARNLGVALGVGVLLFDVAKGAAAVALGAWLGGRAGAEAALPIALSAGLFAVLGHCYSVFVGWRGGKGLATLLGVSLPLYPVAGLAGLALLGAVYLGLRRMRPTIATVMLLYPLLVFLLLDRMSWPRERALAVLAATAATALLIYVKHLSAWRSEDSRGLDRSAN